MIVIKYLLVSNLSNQLSTLTGTFFYFSDKVLFDGLLNHLHGLRNCADAVVDNQSTGCVLEVLSHCEPNSMPTWIGENSTGKYKDFKAGSRLYYKILVGG